MNVLVLAPHPDDEVLGPGATLAWHARQGDSVEAVFLTSGELGLKHLPREQAWAIREAEARRAARILGISRVHFLRQPDWMLGEAIPVAGDLLAPRLAAQLPELVYLPHPADGHPDHRAVLPILQAALRATGCRKPTLLAYEVWTPMPEHDVVRDITGLMSVKLRALRAHASQLREFDYARALRGLNAFRGALAGKCRYAEVFKYWEG